ncbi:MAG: TIGR02679 family protein, partial [Pseudonocardiales bacterium]|nr:TIGR02679 family protein [Pseudonocardiales bacterium]
EAVAAGRSWQAAFAPLDTAVATRPELAAWVAGIRATGLVRRLAVTPDTAAPLLADLATALAALPTEGEPIGRFAERLLGSAHALDDDRPLATLVFGVARVLGDAPDGTGTAWRRDVWARVGLLRDDLSSTVLTLGLPGDSASTTGRVLGLYREAGQPTVLTLRQLVRDPPCCEVAAATVSICENPVVVGMAADRLGRDAAPLVCVAGQPGAAAMSLLRLLAGAGAQLRYHGDFDWGGLRIGNVVFGRLPVTPWRFDTGSYRNAAATGTGRELTGAPVEASWDPGLATTMRTAGRAIEEERVIDDLVADLAVTPPR